MRRLASLKVSPDGSRVYFAAGDFLVFDGTGKRVDTFKAVAGNKLVPLPDGWFLVAQCLYDLDVSARVPGHGRGLITALFAPRSRGQDCIALLGGDYRQRLLEVRGPDGKLLYNTLWHSQPVSVAFTADGKAVYVADDGGRLSLLEPSGTIRWEAELGSVSRVTVHGGRVYAAGWDGRLRCLDEACEHLWALDCTPAMNPADPVAALAASAKRASPVFQAQRPRTTLVDVPDGPNLLRPRQATLKLGGTPGWMSEGMVQVDAAQLTNGKTDDGTTPWLHVDELFWDATAGRQVWAEIAFKAPTDVTSLTVYENPNRPVWWPTEGLVQVWEEAGKRWRTAAFGVFLDGDVNTYVLDLKGVQRLRYLPWNSYYRNFYTSEIEVRGTAR